MEVIILAGGLGTRLREVVKDVPKPMAPINGKPFLEHLLNWLLAYPVKKIVFSVGYKAEVIQDYFGNSYGNINLSYSIEDNPLGTGGAIKHAMKDIADEQVLIVNGDTYFPIDINRLYADQAETKGEITLAVTEMKQFDRYGSINMEGNNIESFNEKQYKDSGIINGGIYLINRSFFNSLDLPEVFSFEKEILERYAGAGKLKGVIFDDSFIDIGVPEDYNKACSTL
nr:nucleotidyltransferase family protein [uncultured Mucilaginibacter sp.]